MSLSQGFPNTFSVTQQTQEVLKNTDNETKKIYTDVNGVMAANGHAHTGNGSDGAAVKAVDVVNVPAGNIASATVQAALNELDTKKVPLSLATTAGDILYATATATLARLGIVADKRLFGNAAGTAPEWATGIKSGKFTRDMTAASSNVSYTGIGFKPSELLAFANVNTTGVFSIGSTSGVMYYTGGTVPAWYTYTSICLLNTGTGNDQTATLSAFDADGFTLAWTKNVSPTGTANIYYIAFR